MVARPRRSQDLAAPDVVAVARRYAEGAMSLVDTWEWLLNNDDLIRERGTPADYRLAGEVILWICEVSAGDRTDTEVRAACGALLDTAYREAS